MNLKTLELISMLPYWFSAKHKGNTESSTYKFIDVFANILKELEDSINFAFDLCALDTFNNNDYICHKIEVDNLESIYADGAEVKRLEEYDFIKSCTEKDTTYTYDNEHCLLYISNVQNKTITINGIDMTNKLVKHLIWKANIIDEFGLLLDMKRLDGESNLEYKNRLLEYCYNKGNSSIHGLTSFLGHSLSLYKIIEWVDGSKDIEIIEDTVISRAIFVDNKPYPCVKTNNNRIVIKGNSAYKGVQRKIKYFVDFDIYNLCDIDNSYVYNDMYNSNNTPTDALIKLVNKIAIKCPIMWGVARWGEHYWLDDEENLFTISPTFDPDISKIKIK